MDEPVPRFPLPTLGGKQIWADVFLYAGYRIQQNVLTRHYRLLAPTDARLAVGSWDHCHKTFTRLRETQDVQPTSDHLVLLLHGIFRSKDSFGPMTRALRADGYEAHPINYPSTRQSLEDHADQVEALLNRAEGVSTLSLVTHSMGGIVSRVLLARKRSPWRRRIKVNRLVMIATPNQGSEIALRLDNVPAFGAVAGPSLQQLHPKRASELPLPDVKFGIVAGARGDERGFNPLLTGDDDMTVTVESTKLAGAEDFYLATGAVHTFVMIRPDVVDATLRYLRTGRFTAPEDELD
jgi:pimeloyl-ACP methyl ester carboxylesterase